MKCKVLEPTWAPVAGLKWQRLAANHAGAESPKSIIISVHAAQTVLACKPAANPTVETSPGLIPAKSDVAEIAKAQYALFILAAF